MSESNLRDKLAKVMAERRKTTDAEQSPEAGLTEAAQEERNAEWIAFYEAVRSHALKMRE
ncbi:hypothetical protein [Paenibacillus sp. NEAU-GSW1]|uniref:hypothetical protein n=1 Tax=Paenibacillus sp. NEAU-GSW1 TaxID=2682486 RepID=UPI0012E28D9F|nr:hypothetical protein [Paenibacillus sp. NEAU-GSW1]MUT65849.1 hypothetical protein [Paenibacillus sp. NEAU-GSW1]